MLSLWNSCKIGVKLQAAFALVMLVFVSALASAYVLNEKVAAILAMQDARLIPAQAAMLRTQLSVRRVDDDGTHYVMQENPSLASLYMVHYRQDLVDLATALTHLEELANTPIQRQSIADYQRFLDGPQGYLQQNEAVFALKARGNSAAAIRLAAGFSVVPLVPAGESYDKETASLLAASDAEKDHLVALTKTLAVTLGAVAALLGVLISALISRGISRSVGATSLAIKTIVENDIADLALSLGHLAGGDLTARFASSRTALQVSGTDEIGELMTTYNELAQALSQIAEQYTATTRNLRDLISVVAVNSTSLAAASDEASAAAKQTTAAVAEIAQAIDLVASGAQAQAGSLSDTAAAIQGLSRTAEEIAMVATHQAESIALTTVALGKARRWYRRVVDARRQADHRGSRSLA